MQLGAARSKAPCSAPIELKPPTTWYSMPMTPHFFSASFSNAQSDRSRWGMSPQPVGNAAGQQTFSTHQHTRAGVGGDDRQQTREFHLAMRFETACQHAISATHTNACLSTRSCKKKPKDKIGSSATFSNYAYTVTTVGCLTNMGNCIYAKYI